MAKGYWYISGAVTNPEGMGPYLQAVEPYLAKFNARFLCRDLNTDVREGDAGHLTVMIIGATIPVRIPISTGLLLALRSLAVCLDGLFC